MYNNFIKSLFYTIYSENIKKRNCILGYRKDMPASEEIKENNIESSEPKKALKKKVLIKSKDKVKDLDLSNYGYRTQARIYAIMSLYAYEMNKGDMNLEEVLSFDYEDKNINDSIKQFAKELIEGTINNLERIDAIIEKYSKNWDIKRIQYVDKSILRMSIYSLIYLKEKISKPIIINEAVEIAKIFGDKDSYKFVNGILDGIQEEDL